MIKSLLTLAIILSLVSSASAQHFEITTAAGFGADTMIRAGSNANSNFGGVTAIGVKDEGPNSPVTRKAYFRFDLSSLPARVTHAELALSITTPADPCNPTTDHRINVFGLNDSPTSSEFWSEVAINWQNAPGNDTTSGNAMNNLTTFLGSFANTCQDLDNGDAISFESTSLANFINNDTNDTITLIFTDDSQITSSIGFATKENRVQPVPTLRMTLDVLLGDVNGDGATDLLDVAPFVAVIQSGLYQVEADINLDTVVDLLDIAPFVELLGN